MRRLLGAVAVIGAGAVAVARRAASRPPERPTEPSNGQGGGAGRSITVSGVGVAAVPPSIATVVLGVQTQGASAHSALEENNRRAMALIDSLRHSGIADADLETSQVSIGPRYSETGERITAYQVMNLVTATVRDVAAVGEILDVASRASGDAIRVEHLTFGVEDETPVLAQARADAVHRAHDQAGQLARAAGVRLGRPRSITEEPRTGHAPRMQRMSLAAGMPIQPGMETISVTVEVVYDIDRSEPMS